MLGFIRVQAGCNFFLVQGVARLGVGFRAKGSE